MKPRKHGHRRRTHIDQEVELNITSFMNLMVVLVPFLLTTAVFSRLAVVQIDVPTPKPTLQTPLPPPPKVPPYHLAVRLEANGIVIQSGKITMPLIPRDAEGDYNGTALAQALVTIKAQHPDHRQIDLLMQPETPYGELVAIMDAATIDANGQSLFEDLRLGDILP